MLANERHCIDLRSDVVVGLKEPDVLDSGRRGSSCRSVFFAGHLTLPASRGVAFVIPSVEDEGIATTNVAIAQNQHAM